MNGCCYELWNCNGNNLVALLLSEAARWAGTGRDAGRVSVKQFFMYCLNEGKYLSTIRSLLIGELL